MMANQNIPIPPEDQPIVPDQPFADPSVGRLPNPGDPQPTNPGDNPPNTEARLSVLEQKVAALEQHVGVPGTVGTGG